MTAQLPDKITSENGVYRYRSYCGPEFEVEERIGLFSPDELCQRQLAEGGPRDSLLRLA